MRTRDPSIDDLIQMVQSFAIQEYAISTTDVRDFIKASAALFRAHLFFAGYSNGQITKLTTKFRDAGRRSAPWQPTSSVVPGRPQDGADGNRQNRWLFDVSHKFYADEVNATLVEIKYIFQTLSMLNAPPLPSTSLQNSLIWLLKHQIIPGHYVDPIQLIPIDFQEFIREPRLIQSGHLIPLDRGGRHIPNNTFLMLARSNQIQGNQTLDELIDLMERIVRKHRFHSLPPELNTNPQSTD